MANKDEPVQRYELERLAEIQLENQKQTTEDNKEIKRLITETNKYMREMIDDVKKNYVSTDKLNLHLSKLDLRLSPLENMKKNYNFIVGAVILMVLATLYNLVVNGIKTL